MKEVIVNKENFETEVLKSPIPVVVDFWASWCGPCMMLAPILEEISKERDDVKIAKINVDEEMELAMKFNVDAIPCLMLFKDGKLHSQMQGYRPKNFIEEFINK